MADAADMAAEIMEFALIGQLAGAARPLAPGVPGECDDCGETMPRLVGGRCAFCRDGRRPPPATYDRLPPVAPSPAEEPVMTASKTPDKQTISLPATGAVLRAIRKRATEQDLPMGQTAGSLIADWIAAPAAKPDIVMPSIAELPTEELLDEIQRRIEAAASIDALNAAIARAEVAEAKLAQFRAVLEG